MSDTAAQAAQLNPMNSNTGPPDDQETRVCICGERNAKDEEFCIKCGKPLIPETAATQIESKPTAIEEIPAPIDPLVAEKLRFDSAVPYAVEISYFGMTHPGLSGKNNEDAFVVDGVFFSEHNVDVRFLVVADGMGGGDAGEIIANLAVHEIAAGLWFLMPSDEQHRDFNKLDFLRFTRGQFSRFLCNPIQAANLRIRNYGKAKKLRGAFGATVVMAVVISDLELGHVTVMGYNEGDARCYLATGDKIEQLSTDQTVMGDPTNYLGAFDHIGGKVFQPFETWMREDGQPFLGLDVCSDGSWMMLSPERRLEIFKEHTNARAIAEALNQDCMSNPEPYGKQFNPKTTTGDDNITTATIYLKPKQGEEK